MDKRRFFAPMAWVRGGWMHDVLLETDERGNWLRIEPHAAAQERLGATTLAGPALPGLVNAHCHAFQRAMAGLTERSAQEADDFWSWREHMYSAANRITPQQLEAIAAHL